MGNHLNLENVSLENIAKALQKINKKVQLIYAFNGTGKTRLSLEFYNLFKSKNKNVNEEKSYETIYYNAYTEDLFYWDNDFENENDKPTLKIHPNNFINKFRTVLRGQGKENEVEKLFLH